MGMTFSIKSLNFVTENIYTVLALTYFCIIFIIEVTLCQPGTVPIRVLVLSIMCLCLIVQQV